MKENEDYNENEQIFSLGFISNLFPGYKVERVVLTFYANSGNYSQDFEIFNTNEAKQIVYAGYVNNNYNNTAVLTYKGLEVLRQPDYNKGMNSFVIFDKVGSEQSNLTMFQFIGYRLIKN
jgi:hypothetical protein